MRDRLDIGSGHGECQTLIIGTRDASGEMQATEEAAYMGAVAIPSVQHLLNGSLDVLREAIDSASAEEEPTRWVVSHIILGSALRVRASHATDEERARMYTEALSAFDTALQSCRESQQPRPALVATINGGNFSSPQALCAGPDGVQLAVEGARMPLADGNELLERAVRVFREHCAKSNRRGSLSQWFVGMSNLGCALTLLGRRTSGAQGVALLEEAVDVMHEALRTPTLEKLATERASTQVNLAEALQALAERALPAEGIRYLEDAAHWLAAALSHFAPSEYRWLLQLDRGAIS